MRVRVTLREDPATLAVLTPPPIYGKVTRVSASLIAITATVALLYFGQEFFVTLITSAIFAFLLDPAVSLVMRLRVPRGLATALVIGITLIALYLLGLLIWTQAANLAEDFPTYSSRVNELFDKASARLDEVERDSIAAVIPRSLRQQEQQIEQKPQEAMKARRRRSAPTLRGVVPPLPPSVQEVRIHSDPQPVIATLYRFLSGYAHALIMASFVPFLVFFMLSWGGHVTNAVMHLFEGEQRLAFGRAWIGIGDSTRAYVIGNFILWIFISSISAALFFFLGVPYWALAGPLSGFCSLIPYAGLPLSLIPPVLAVLAVPNKFKTVLLVIALTAALHVLAMNFLYAKIIGRRVRLNPLAVTVALMFFGSLWGGAGLILAVPVTAAFKAVCDSVESWNVYGKLLGD